MTGYRQTATSGPSSFVIGAAIFTTLIGAIVILVIPTDSSRERDDRWAEYKRYQNERTVARVCADGTKIYRWDGRLWTYGSNLPDLEVTSRLEDVCR